MGVSVRLPGLGLFLLEEKAGAELANANEAHQTARSHHSVFSVLFRNTYGVDVYINNWRI